MIWFGLATLPQLEVRGVWMTTTANRALATKEDIRMSFRRLKRIGINTIYLEVWKDGYTQFPSITMKKLIGVDRKPSLGRRDLLAEAVAEAKKNDLRLIAWFEYGFMAAHEGTDNHLVRQFPDWMTTTSDGKQISSQNPFVWMNPMRPESQDLLLGIMKEAVAKYEIDGVQLDDRIAWPVTMGYDEYTTSQFRKENGGENPPSNHQNSQWMKWRANKVTAFAGRMQRELKAVRRDIEISISPAIFPWSYENYLCNWVEWQKNGWMDEYVPQVYRQSAAAAVSEWKRQIEHSVADHKLRMGIMVNSGEFVKPWNEIKLELDASKGYGHVLWFSKGVLDRYEDDFRRYYERKSGLANVSPQISNHDRDQLR